MRVLVTGGSGVVGESAVRELHGRGHTVRVLTRHAGRDQKWWPVGVDGWAGDVGDEETIRGAAEGCDAILHIAGIVEERPPATYQRVNIDGTRYVVLEGERAGVRKIVYVSSLGAERGASAYHKSKYVAEDVVRTFTRDWVVIRPGAVYGPGDEHISVLLRMVRTLPAVPTIGDGNQKFQPIWHQDLAEVLALAIERPEVRCATFDVAGTDVTSQNDLVARLRPLTGRAAVQAPLTETIAQWGVRALDALGVEVPFKEAQFAMLREGNVIEPGSSNALVTVFDVSPTPLSEGLARLADEQPEQLPSAGVGALTRKRYWVDVRGSRYDADGLFAYVRGHLTDLMPRVVESKAEPGASTRVEEGEALTLELPLRGHVQVRVAEVEERRITLLTVVGHPLAGAVRFLVEPRGDALRFEVQTYERPASTLDLVVMRTVGEWLQRGFWSKLAENVARAAGGSATDVQTEDEALDEPELHLVDEWASALSAQLSRKATSSGRD